jgi:hypothetical protein
MKRLLVGVLCIVITAGQSFALTNGPSQQEFASFEPVDATDLVNLPTGDFTYTLPLGKVQTPDGIGYPVVLSYHAGIMNDQEASWVGLGWTLNVGAINRSVRNLPDDYSGYSVVSHMFDPGEWGQTWDIGVGWMGVSATVGWTSKGSGGVVFDGLTSLSAGMGFGDYLSAGWSANLRGNSVFVGASAHLGGFRAGLGFQQQGTNTPELGLSAGYNNIASFSLSSSGNVGGSVFGMNAGMYQSRPKEGLHSTASNMSVDFPLPYGFSINLGNGFWSWYYDYSIDDHSNGYLFQSKWQRKVVRCNDYLENRMVDNNSQFNYKSAGITNEPSYPPSIYNKEKVESYNIGEYTFPSQDLYSMSGQSISGAFMPRTVHSKKYYYSGDQKENGINGKCNGDLNYDCYDGNWLFDKEAMAFGAGINFKSIDEVSSNFLDTMVDGATGKRDVVYPGMDDYLNIDLKHEGTANTFVTGKQIIPLFGLSGDRVLNGFIVIDQEGKTYYYTCPLYSYYQTTYVNDQPRDPGKGWFKDADSYTCRYMVHPYATAWLLTAVTGPDYIKMIELKNEDGTVIQDVNEKLLPHQGDWGYWVRFNYSYGLPVEQSAPGVMPTLKTPSQDTPEMSVLDKAASGWRLPYWDSQTKKPLPHQYDPCLNQHASMYGVKDVTYLKSIETASEVAYFRTSERLDGYGPDWGSMEEKQGTSTLQYGVKQEGLKTALSKITSNVYSPKIYPVPTLDEIRNGDGSYDLSKCLQLICDANEVPLSSFSNAKAGDELFNIKMNAHVVWAHRAPLLCLWSINRWINHSEGVSIRILKDTYGCDFSDPQKPTISEEYGLKDTYEWHHFHETNAKCIFAETIVKDNKSYTVFYVISYHDKDIQLFDNEDLRTSIELTPFNMFHKFFKVRGDLTDVTITTGKDVWNMLDDSKYCRFAKKLDEVAWYSKAQYPYIDGSIDPQEPFVKDNSFWSTHRGMFPKSYRRMKFRYNYELAQGTPNSFENGGRLTLKEVYEQAGPEDNWVNMPSYLFKYQGADEKYKSFDDIDGWGFKKPTYEYSSAELEHAPWDINPVRCGVQWNLSKITLPTCGSIEINYGRDIANSSWMTAARLNKEYDKCNDRHNKIELSPLQHGAGNTYTGAVTFIQPTENSPDIFIPVPSQGDDNFRKFKPGMLSYIRYTGISDNISSTQASYMYRVVAVYPETRTITLDKPINPPSTSEWQLEKREMIGIVQMAGFCDGVRVNSLKTKSLSGVTTTRYDYPSGVIETAPETEIPAFFSQDGRYGEQNYNVPDIFLEFNEYNATWDDELIGRKCSFWSQYRGVQTRSIFDGAAPNYDGEDGCAARHPIPENAVLKLQEIYPHRSTYNLYILYNFITRFQTDPLYGRVKIYKTSDNSVIFENNYVEFFPTSDIPNDNGVTSNIPCRIAPALVGLLENRDLEERIDVEITFPAPTEYGEYVRVAGVCVKRPGVSAHYRKYEPMYTTGNTNVIYPFVDVQQVTNSGKMVNGITRYNFYTFEDTTLHVNGSFKPILGSRTDDGIDLTNDDENIFKVWKIEDRTSIIGLIKSTQKIRYDNSGYVQVVNESEKKYAFSDDMSRDGIGVLTDMESRLPGDKPLGMSRERSMRIANGKGINSKKIYVKTIADVMKFKPYLVSIVDKTDYAPKSASFGLFNAYTGGAMATLSTVPAPEGSGVKARLDVSVPYNFLIKDVAEQQNVASTIASKNLYALPGGTISCSNNGNIAMPDKISDIPVNEFGTDGKNAWILSGSCNEYGYYDIGGEKGAPIEQGRLSLQKTLSWVDQPNVPFSWPFKLGSKSKWIRNSLLDSIDWYSRPLTELNALDGVSSVINNPVTNAVIASISNAEYQQCAIYTADYEDYSDITNSDQSWKKLYFDKLNGWKLGDLSGTGAMLELESPDGLSHFGLRCLHVKNSSGPVKEKIPVKLGSDYLFSAWICPANGNTNPIRFAVSSYIKGSECKDNCDNVVTGLTSNKWQYVQFKIDKSKFPASAPNDVRLADIAVGNNSSGDVATDFYIQDIRFYPADALVSTFYYDYNLVVPVTFVDANNKAKYFKYDVFGRVIEKGIIKEE